MKYTAALIASAAVVVASGSLVRADQASDIADCLAKYNCGTDTTCTAKCFPSAAPTQEQVDQTNQCIQSACANEGQGNLSPADCQTYCVNKYFLAPNADASNSTSSSGSSSGGKGATVDDVSNGAAGHAATLLATAIAAATAVFMFL